MENKPEPGSKLSEYASELEPAMDKLAQNRSFIPVSFVLVIIFFFFGFCSFKCNGTKVASLKGINLVTGTHLKTQMGEMLNNNPFGMMGGSNENTNTSKGQKVPANFWAILAFASAIAGLVIFYRKEKREALFGTLLGSSGFISLVILQLVIKSKVETQGGGMVNIETSFLFGYWASLLAFIVAGGISYLRYKREQKTETKQEDKPPAPTPIHVNIITQNTDPD